MATELDRGTVGQGSAPLFNSRRRDDHRGRAPHAKYVRVGRTLSRAISDQLQRASRWLVAVATGALMILSAGACVGPAQPSVEPTATEVATPPSRRSEYAFEIEKVNTVPGIKREVYIRINAAVTEDAVKEIATTIKAQDPAFYERTFVVFLLPGMRDGQGAWATAFFDPDLKVRILGVTKEQLARAEAKTIEPTAESRKRLGLWIDDSELGSGSIWEIYQQAGKSYADETFKDGGVLTAELREVHFGKVRKFIVPERTQEAGDHMLITSSGSLEFRDNAGLIRVARRVP